ncbi:MAG: tRNA pseudouridine(55) synthase TruB [Planctomycetota bacterium]
MFGFLNIDKPAGMTSRDVVNRIQRLVRPCKVGHAGTLDPLATGVLVVCLGHATRLVDYVHRYAKRYDALFLLGRASDTEDIEGHVTELPEALDIHREQLEAVLPRFHGQISQVPPAYSALKVDGQRAYARARRGEAVAMEARPAMIHSARCSEFQLPSMRLDIACGTGTYVRSLGRDIARALGTEAVMAELRRVAIGPFSVEQSVALATLEREGLAGIASHLLPPGLALVGLGQRQLTESEERRVRQGQTLDDQPDGRDGGGAANMASESTAQQLDFPPPSDNDFLAAYGSGGRLTALLRKAPPNHWRPTLVFPLDSATA